MKKLDLICHFHQQARKIERYSKRTQQKHESTDVHHLRVALRRLRAALWVARHNHITLSHTKKLKKEVKEFDSVLGGLRQMELALETAKQYDVDIKQIKKLRHDSEQSLAKHFKTKQFKTLSKYMDEALDDIKKSPQENLIDSLQDLRVQTEGWLRQPPKTPQRLHQFRVFIKKARYIFEIYNYNVAQLKRTQDALGKAHDLQVLLDLVKSDAILKHQTKTAWQAAHKRVLPTLHHLQSSLIGQ